MAELPTSPTPPSGGQQPPLVDIAFPVFASSEPVASGSRSAKAPLFIPSQVTSRHRKQGDVQVAASESGQKGPVVVQKKKKKRREEEVCVVEELLEVGPAELLLPSMLCSLCKTSSVPDVFTCTAGHVVCAPCRPNVLRCPFYVNGASANPDLASIKPCAAPYRSRLNPLYKAVYLQSRVTCDNPGCSDSLRGKHLAQHKRSCPFTTTLMCSFRELCGSKGVPFADAVRHLKAHGVPVHDTSRRVFTARYDPNDVDSGSVVRVLLTLQDETFAVMTNGFGNTYLFFVVTLKSKLQAKRNFSAKMTLIGRNGVRLEYRGPVLTYGDRNDAMNMARCVTIDKELLKSTFLHPKDILLFAVDLELLRGDGGAVVEWKPEEGAAGGERRAEDLQALLETSRGAEKTAEEVLRDSYAAFCELT